MFGRPRARTAPNTPTIHPNLNVAPFAPSRSPPRLHPLTPFTPLTPRTPPPPAPLRGPASAPSALPSPAAPTNPFEAEMAAFLTDLAPEPEAPHPLLAAPLPPAHAMAAHIHELRAALADAQDEAAYLAGRVRSAGEDNAYLCRQVTTLTEQREALRDRLEGRVPRGGEWNGRDWRREYCGAGKREKCKEGRYA